VQSDFTAGRVNREHTGIGRVLAVIPARMGSSRFPGKPLVPLAGLPMVEHVRRRVALCPDVGEVVVATPDPEIRAVVERFGGKVVMTSHLHQRASERVAEVAKASSADIVMMVQGDEPLVTLEMVRRSLDPFAEPGIQCVNLTRAITDRNEFVNPNVIKIARDREGKALYFSRQPIPTGAMDLPGVAAWKQICVIPFRRDAVLRFAQLEPTPGEIAESVDMLRFIEHGIPVHLVETSTDSMAVDVPEDVPLIEALLAKDPVLSRYTEHSADPGGRWTASQ
jgi:3-deoxy-manno-octulosonate cytidylyltransferase (CMP-KDO synthetase)